MPREVVTSKKPKYRSRLEQDIASHLERVGAMFEYESIRLPYTRECVYTPDFILPNGIIVEAKGWFRSSDRSKLALVKKRLPSIDIRIVFQRSGNRLNKQTKTTYAEWANKNGFPHAEGRIPEGWLKEKNETTEFEKLCKQLRRKVRGKT